MTDQTHIRRLRQKATDVLSHRGGNAGSGVAGFPEEVAALLEELEEYKVALKQQTAQMETLVASLPLATMVVDDIGVIQEANDRAAELLGLRSKSFIEHHSLLRLVGSDDRELVLESIRKQSEDGITKIGPITVGHDGSELVDFFMTKLPRAFHPQKRIVITAIERTRHYYNMRRVLLLETLVDAADLRILAFDTNNRCLFANKKELKRIGSSAAELVGKRRDHWMSDAETLKREQQDQLVLTTEKSCLFEEKIDSIGEDDHYYVTQKFPLVAEDQKLFGVGIISTEVKRGREHDAAPEIDLAVAGEKPQSAAVVVADRDGRINLVNPAFSQIMGLGEQAVIGRRLGDLVPEQHRGEYTGSVLPSFEAEQSWEGPFWLERNNGSIVSVQLSITRVAPANGQNETIIAVFEEVY